MARETIVQAEEPHNDREEPLHGWLLNRSTGGVALLVEEALETETTVQITPDAPGGAQRWVEVRVVYCCVERIRWRVGCQFLRRLPWDELRMFG